ncbi:hypothetical protein M407DRAFT_33054 [Tulasnella calospora MUT 4182]|uniref:Uncharacterized protein n=1 Tax=Tulasnella calospora MUT 4182 TaxID=1051891 RepID=A0A0C3PRM2_9AGAM|nr:hypothetical protein M407DRAFT_33054 [Tulasnella calospora MUT 4182]
MDAPSAAPSIILPHLENLTLFNIPQQAISSILRSIHTPRFSTFVIAPDLTHRDPDTPFLDLNPDLEHLVPALQYAIAEGKIVELTILSDGVTIVVKRYTNDTCFMIRTGINGLPHLQSHLGWLQSNMGLKAECASGIREGTVSFGWGTRLERSIHFQTLEWIPNIIELKVAAHGGTSELIQYLTERFRRPFNGPR